MRQHRHFSSDTMKNHGNMVKQKENDNFPATKPKDMEYCNITDKEFTIAVMKKSNELQKNSGRQFNELKNKINEQKEYFTKETEILNKNPTKSGAELNK